MNNTFFVRAATDDLLRIIGQRPLQRLRFVPRRAHPIVALFLGRQITSIAFGWIGLTTALGAVVRKPYP